MKQMEIRSHDCRCCGKRFFPDPVLSYHNMPARAQNYPSAENLDKDRGIDLDILQCPGCGLIQIGGEPVDYYRDVLRAVGISEEMKRFRRDYFRQFVTDFALQDRRIIEIGAGCGEYMELFAELGVDVRGLEHRAESVAAGREKGLQMYQGFVEGSETGVPGGPYDAFYTMSFLEHVPVPNDFLRGIAGGLKEDGVGLVEVPNGDFILQNHMFSEFMLDHLSYFTEGTLRFILEKNGFRVLSCRPVWNDYILSAVVQKRTSGAQWERFRSCQDTLVNGIRGYADKLCGAGGRLAVWGAGHQALALLSLAGLQDRVAFVVDSAPFKQGLYTPATHIPVVPPERIEQDKIDAVLIMAGSYSQEIADIMRKRWPRVKTAMIDAGGVTELEGQKR